LTHTIHTACAPRANNDDELLAALGRSIQKWDTVIAKRKAAQQEGNRAKW
jgi:hypothetical protein